MLENAKIINSAEFQSIAGERYHGKISYHHMLAKLTCNPPLPACCLFYCHLCGDKDDLQHLLTDPFNQMNIDEINYKSWVSVNRTSLETITQSVDGFITKHFEGLLKLQRHSFIAHQQSSFMRDFKASLAEGETLVVGYNAEN